MTPEHLAQQLLQTEGETEQRRLLIEHRAQIGPALLEAIKVRVDEVNLQDPQQALRMAEVARLAAEVAGDDLCRALALWTKSHPLMNLERYADGLVLCDEALALCRRSGHEYAAARVQVSRMWPLINLGRFDEALRLSESARPVLERYEDRLFLARLDMNVGVAHDFADRYQAALAAYERARALFAALGNPVQVTRIDMNRAIAYDNLDRFDEALSIFQKIRPFFFQKGMMLEAARADFNIAILYFRQGEYGAALHKFRAAYAGFRALDIASEMDQVLLYESELYLELNLFDEVIERCRAFEQRFDARGIERDVILARLIRALAHGYRRQPGDRERAIALLTEVRDALLARDVSVLAAQIGLEMAVLLHDAGQYDEALKRAQAAEAVFAARALAVKRARAQLVMATCLHALGDSAHAHRLYRSSLEALQANALPQLAYRCYHGLGRLAEAEGDLVTADLNYRAAIESVERIRRRLSVDDLRISFLDDKLDLYADMVLLCLRRGDEEAAFEYAERAKARALVELLSSATEIARPRSLSEQAALIDEELQQLRKEWSRLNSRNWHHTVMEERGDITDALLDTEGEDARRRMNALEKRILRLERQLQLEDPGRRLLGEGAVAQVADIQRDLHRKSVLIEYFTAHDRVVAFVVGPETHIVRVLPATVQEVEGLVQEMLIDLPDIGAFPEHAEVWHSSVLKRLSRLYDRLVAPLLGDLQDCRELIIVPHGMLYYLPFHALHNGEEYLLERFLISYAPSATVFSFCQQAGSPAAAGSLLIGFSGDGQLPHTIEEVRRITSLFPEATVLLEQEATKVHLWKHSQDSRLVHIASHATFRGDNPLFSSLHLADGDLIVNEVYGLKLDAALVTLSACATGVSTLKGGDLIGLASGFFYAGARSLVVSLWRVRDVAAAELMERFYRKLTHGEGKAAALRAAQLDLMQAPGHRYPYYWAPFVLVGDSRPLEF